MKKGQVLKQHNLDSKERELELVNQYTRKPLSSDDVYIFSVVLCDNDIDRDNERFTVEALFELEKLFVGKTGIFDHNASAHKQTARIISCFVEAVDGKKTATGDDYFRLVCRAYIPINDKTKDLIESIECGILKEVSVGCAVKNSLCSICSNDIHSVSCTHTKGQTYNGKLCYAQLCDVYDAYEFSFVAVPAQKNAGVIKAFSKNERKTTDMRDILTALEKGKEIKLNEQQCNELYEYINELKALSEDGKTYKEKLKADVYKYMCVAHQKTTCDVLKSIVDKMSVSELKDMLSGADKEYKNAPAVQLFKNTDDKQGAKSDTKNQFTI